MEYNNYPVRKYDAMHVLKKGSCQKLVNAQPF